MDILDKVINDPIFIGVAILIAMLVLYSILKKMFKFLAIIIAIAVIYIIYLTQVEGLSYEDATNKVKQGTEGITKNIEEILPVIVKEGKETLDNLQNGSKKESK